MIGTIVSHYRVAEKLGEGGMGVVYRAQDIRLNRVVALKIMSADAMAHPDRKKRFIQEARAASALNHPNIVTVHDIDNAEGVDFIAMEYVDGKTLEQTMGHRALALADALRYSIEIADALAAAHAAGIVHRDLKPGNIMITDRGRVKVLDFGLAKLSRPDAEATGGEDMTRTQGMTGEPGPRTEEGTIVGTVAYMSPEQACGKRVDRRSDIFSFGSVLYEMVTGSRPFRGADKVSILAAILQQDPPPANQLDSLLPPELDRIIRRCLRKDPERRFQDMDDVRVALQELKEDSESGRLARPAPAAPARTRSWLPLIAAALLLIAATGGATWWLFRAKPAEVITGLTRLTNDSGLTWEPALSPDGKLIAYSSDRGAPAAGESNLDIWVQQVTGGEPIRLTQDPADDREPDFSPDSARLAFHSDREGGGIYVAPALGGEARLIASSGQTPRFSPDGQWIAYWVGNRATGDPAAPGSAQAYVVASTGGTPRRFHAEFSVIRAPIWTPDSKHLLFWGKRDANATGPESTDWWVAPLDGAAVKTGAAAALRQRNLSDAILPRTWLPDGRVLFATSDLWYVAIPPATWKVTEPPVRMTVNTAATAQPSVAVGRDHAGQAIVRLAFSGLARNTQIWSVPLDVNRGTRAGALRRRTQGPAAAQFGSVSSDGRELVFERDRVIWIKDLQTGRETAVTAGGQFHPRIAADGSRISYSETKDTQRAIYTMPIKRAGDGGFRAGVPEKLCDVCRWSWQWSWDGKRILFDPGAAGRPYIAVANLVSGETASLVSHPQYNLYQANSSPDGRWVAFLAHIDARHGRIFIAPFQPGVKPSDWIPATSEQFWADKPRWSPDGNLLYFISDQDGFLCFWGLRLDPASKRPLGQPFGVYHFHNASRSMINVGLANLEPWVAPGEIGFNLMEITGNIWMASLETAR